MRIFLFLLLALPLFAQAPNLNDDEVGEEIDVGWDLMDEAREQFFNGLEEVKVQYMKDLSKAVAKADRAEIFLLDFEITKQVPLPEEFDEKTLAKIEKELGLEQIEGQPEREKEERIEGLFFLTSPYEGCSKILQRKELKGEFLSACKEAVAEILNKGVIGGGAFCHYPIHGIRLYVDDLIVFESSLCWECGNYFVYFPDDGNSATWIGIGGEKIEKFCMKEMPIPQAELDRFKSKYGPKK